MFEIVVLLIIGALCVACGFSPLAALRALFRSSASVEQVTAPEPIEIKEQSRSETASFVTYLKNEVEAELFPRPTCSVLQRHYDSLVAAELESRLALMAE